MDFYEGLAKTFNDVYVVHRQQAKMVKIIERSFEYLSKAAPAIISQSGYLIEDDVQTDQIVLRKVVVHQNGGVRHYFYNFIFPKNIFWSYECNQEQALK